MATPAIPNAPGGLVPPRPAAPMPPTNPAIPLPQPPPNDPAANSGLPICRAWRPPPPTPEHPGFWITGCVQAAAGYQCAAGQPLTPAPNCRVENLYVIKI